VDFLGGVPAFAGDLPLLGVDGLVLFVVITILSLGFDVFLKKYLNYELMEMLKYIVFSMRNCLIHMKTTFFEATDRLIADLQ
jgi:hypothetical protein